jgi:glyoxylase-like metal-dependent hydrolase (beta-lactamase superfamily II)
VEPVAPCTALIDVQYLGRPQTIGAYVLEDDSGVAIVDPGPTSSLATLLAKLEAAGRSVNDVHTLLLTHIHLDHAGATGTLVQRNPRIRVYVHERGAPHMVDPAKLLQSATRLYGDLMDYLWGEFLAVPADRVHALRGGETITVGGRKLEVIYTPGHAVHHVAYFDAAEGLAFCGDVGGIRAAGGRHVLPVTPPPDIDLEAWSNSLSALHARRPERLLPTHFGAGGDVPWHIEALREGLARWGELTRLSLATGASDEHNARQFATQALADLRTRFPDADLAAALATAALEQSWYGLARYWRKKAPVVSHA